MKIEIERKFLVKNTDFIKSATKKSIIKQGFLNKEPERTVRIRLIDDKAFITVKGISENEGTERYEFEKQIDTNDAKDLLKLCIPHVIEKTRYYIPVKNHIFEVDVFEGKNKGLIIAEIELNNKDEYFEKPEWLGKEVTGDIRFYNSYISNQNTEKQEPHISKITDDMLRFFENDEKRKHHALKVFSYAKIIGKSEKLTPEQQTVVEICGLLHDTGIKICEEKYGTSNGKCQEKESPVIANEILSKYKIKNDIKKRILYIIANHHSYSKIDDTDFRILIEADFLVNFEEGNEDLSKSETVRKNIFKTETGLFLLDKFLKHKI